MIPKSGSREKKNECDHWNERIKTGIGAGRVCKKPPAETLSTLAKGIDQLMDEGVAQLFINQFNGRKIIGTVGQLQFEVIQYRLENEYNAKCRWEPVSLYKACWVESDDPEELEAFKKRKYQYMAKDREGRDVFLADSNYVLQMAQMDFKHIKFHLCHLSIHIAMQPRYI